MSVNPYTSPHFKALKQFFPLEMDAEEFATAKELDRVLEYANGAYLETFPSSANDTLSRWETLYELSGIGTIEDRRQALLAAINRDSGIAERHYIALAEAMGFSVSIVKPPRMFRTGISRAGFEIYGKNEQYTWTVVSPLPEASCQTLVKVFETQKIPFTAIQWTFERPESGRLLLESGGALLLEDNNQLLLENENG